METIFKEFGSIIFDNAKTIDYIRQIYVDLNQDTDSDSVKKLLQNLITELSQNNSYDISNELIFLIKKCFSYFNSDLLQLFDKLFEISKTNSYATICFASVFSDLIKNKVELKRMDYFSFVDDVLNQIQPQIQNLNNLTIFTHIIPFQFRIDLILDILLLSKLTNEIITTFSSFLISKDTYENKKFPELIEKISTEKLMKHLPTSILTNIIKDINNIERYHNNLSQDILLNKISPEITTYKYNLLAQIAFSFAKDNDADFNSSKFYIQLYSLFEKKECPLKLTQTITTQFKDSVPIEKSNEIIDEMIFAFYPPNRQQTVFLTNFFNSLGKEYLTAFYSNDHMNEFVTKILQKKVTPYYKFVQLFDKETVYQLLQQQNGNPLLIYLYYFSEGPSKKSAKKQLNEITILSQNAIEINNEKLVKFIKTHNYDLLAELDEKSLSLASGALVFSDNDIPINVHGLTGENSIPFYSIAAFKLYEKNVKNKLLDAISSQEMIIALSNGLSFTAKNQSQAITASIDSLLLHFTSLQIFSPSFKQSVITLFYNIFAQGGLYANQLLLYYCMTFFKIIPLHAIDENYLIDILLLCPCPQKKTTLTNGLIKIIQSEKTNKDGYLQLLLENLDEQIIEPGKLLAYFPNEYAEYKDDFINAVNNVFIFNQKENVFVKRADHKSFELQDNDKNNRITTKLFDAGNKDPSHFQAFFCLELIANSFPFIFSKNPEQVFNSVLPALDFMQLIFEDQTENIDYEEIKSKKGKAAIAAISFLILSLNSTKVIDAFIPWFFQNYQSFTLSQVFCFIWLFAHLTNACNDKNSRNTVLSSFITKFIKHNFFNVCLQMIPNDVPQSLFGYNFNFYLYRLLINLYNAAYSMNDISALEIKDNLKRNDLFYHMSGQNITHFNFCFPVIDFNYLQFDKKRIALLNPNPFYFLFDNSKIKPDWLHRNPNDSISKEQINDFLNRYKELADIPEVVDYSPLEIPNDITVKMVRYILNKDRWVHQYLLYGAIFPCLPDHIKVLKETLQHLPKLTTQESSDDEFDNNLLKDFIYNNQKMKCLSSFHISETFLTKLLTRTLSTYTQPIDTFLELIQKISQYTEFPQTFLSILKQNFIDITNKFYYFTDESSIIIYDNYSILDRFCMVQLSKRSAYDYSFNQIYFYTCGFYLNDFVLMPQYRSNEIVLGQYFQQINSFGQLPNQVLQIISFMMMTNKDYIQRFAALLCFRFEDKSLINNKILKEVFYNEINSKKPRIPLIACILMSSPSFKDKYIFNLEYILIQLLQNYPILHEEEKIEESKKDDFDKKYSVSIGDFIIQLLDILSPDRDSNSMQISDSIESCESSENAKPDPMFRFFPIPEFILIKNIKFWQIFMSHRKLINDLVLNKLINVAGFDQHYLQTNPLLMPHFSSNFVSNYPECFSFDFRSRYFHHVMITKLKGRVDLYINRDNILEESFDILGKLKPEQWFNDFHITFANENGEDVGGLKRSWFFTLSEEIFGHSKLFESTENGNYLPYRFITDTTNEDLEKYELVGKFVARALTDNSLISGYFTRPFLKNILGHANRIKNTDLLATDSEKYNNLMSYLNFNFDDNPDYEIYFAAFDGMKDVPLKENGNSIRVNDQNKKEYIDLMIDFELRKLGKEKIDAFCKGFNDLIPHKLIRIFSPNELNLLISGVPKIDVDDFRNNAKFDRCDADSPTVKMFFDLIKKWPESNRAQLLMAITGSSRIHPLGFKYFKQINLPITIALVDDKDRLPCFHVCINQMDLPKYDYEDEMNEKLLMAIQEVSFQIK